MKRETVSICVIAYNEEKFLPRLFSDFSKQTYPHELIEIVLVDGGSTDNTKQIMIDYSRDSIAGFYSIKVLENLKKIQASGWNLALLDATGDVIIRIDAHTSIPASFVVQNLCNLQNGEFISGGRRPCLIEGDSKWSEVLLQTENSMFGSSIGRCKYGAQKQYVKTMFHAAYRREVFAKVGGFNENLIRTEDNEIHYRIRNSGYKLCFDPQIISYQYARNSLKKMIIQKYGNGYWVGITLGVSPKSVSIYHLVPFVFVLSIIFSSILSFFGIWVFSFLLWSAYFLLGLFNTVITMKKIGINPFVFTMPFLFLLLHASYGLGSIFGMIKIPKTREKYKYCPEIEMVKLKYQNSYNK